MTERFEPDMSPEVFQVPESVKRVAVARAQSVDPRMHAAWRSWLSALATDAEAAIAAALAYASLTDEGRDAWLDALEVDAPLVAVPAIALYGPLLGVERCPTRTKRMALALGDERLHCATDARVCLASIDDDRVCMIVTPLYLQFVDLLLCRYNPDRGVVQAHRESLIRREDAHACVMHILGDVTFCDGELRDAVEELAHAVVADSRAGREPPEALRAYIDLFVPDLPHESLVVHDESPGAVRVEGVR